MNQADLLGFYTSRPIVISIKSRLLEPFAHRFRLEGLSGSSDAVIAAAITDGESRTHVFVLNDREEAAYFLNNMENLREENPPLYFPSSYKKPFQIEELDNANVLMRAEVLGRLNRGSNTLVVTYPDAICEKVVTRHNLEKNSIEMRVGEKISVEFITEFLLHHEFENVDFVAQAGEFSVRGGIVDIFSFAYELPYRIEFYGDDVESIRTFDPGTQLSVQAMNHITIMPNVQKKLMEESRSSFLILFLHQLWCGLKT